MRKFATNLLAAGAVLVGAWSAGSAPADAADLGAVDEPIKLAILEWTGAHVTTHIAGHILQKMGYKVEYVTASNYGSATAVADGSIAASLEQWDNNLGEFYPKLIAEGKIEDIGDVGLAGREGWLYPVHMKEKCPGLPAWDAFKSCAQAFAAPETFPNGRLLSYPADWGTRSADLIAGEGLPYTAIPSGSEGAMVAELTSAAEAKTPLVMMFWAPHWSLAKVETEWLDMPREVQEAHSLVPPRIFKAAWPGMADKWPAAYEFLKNFQISNAVQEPIMGAVDNDGQDVVKVTGEWVENNESVWKPMVDKATM
ncbi:MAG: ABC transporter substrate-binding protein [Rhodospirillales bacterium]